MAFNNKDEQKNTDVCKLAKQMFTGDVELSETRMEDSTNI